MGRRLLSMVDNFRRSTPSLCIIELSAVPAPGVSESPQRKEARFAVSECVGAFGDYKQPCTNPKQQYLRGRIGSWHGGLR